MTWSPERTQPTHWGAPGGVPSLSPTLKWGAGALGPLIHQLSDVGCPGRSMSLGAVTFSVCRIFSYRGLTSGRNTF